MSENQIPDPYATPQAEMLITPVTNDTLRELEYSKLKKLYYRSCNVNAINFLLVLGVLIMGVFALLESEAFKNNWVYYVLLLFYIVAAVGLYLRTVWGRILGIIISIISLMALPIGTIIGIVGLFAFFGAPQLFGKNRITHKELKAAFKVRKAQDKEERAWAKQAQGQ